MKTFIFLACFFFANSSQAQVTVAKKQLQPKNLEGFYISGGVALSSINIFRNYIQNPYKISLNTRLYWVYSKNTRLVAEYNHTPTFNLSPTWLNVKNRVGELNVNFMAHIKDELAQFYAISGIFYQRWNGFYTGQSDFNTTKNIYVPQRYYSNSYVGINLGVGIERAFRYIQLFGDFKFRFTKTGDEIGILDAVYNVGLKTKLPDFKKIYKGLQGRYTWF